MTRYSHNAPFNKQSWANFGVINKGELIALFPGLPVVCSLACIKRKWKAGRDHSSASKYHAGKMLALRFIFVVGQCPPLPLNPPLPPWFT